MQKNIWKIIFKHQTYGKSYFTHLYLSYQPATTVTYERRHERQIQREHGKHSLDYAIIWVWPQTYTLLIKIRAHLAIDMDAF